MGKYVLTASEINEICIRLGGQLQAQFLGKCPIFIGVLKGAIPFMSDLLKHVKCDVIVDYCQVSSYIGTSSTNILNFKKDLDNDISGKDIVIVEDIVDTGQTLSMLVEKFQTRNPKSITTVTLFDKPSKRIKNIKPDYVGKTIDDLFVVGYGLDLNGVYRNVPYVFDYKDAPDDVYNV